MQVEPARLPPDYARVAPATRRYGASSIAAAFIAAPSISRSTFSRARIHATATVGIGVEVHGLFAIPPVNDLARRQVALAVLCGAPLESRLHQQVLLLPR